MDWFFSGPFQVIFALAIGVIVGALKTSKAPKRLGLACAVFTAGLLFAIPTCDEDADYCYFAGSSV